MSEYFSSIDQLLQSFYNLSRQKRFHQNQIFESFSNHLQKSNGANCFLVGGYLIDILLPDEFIEFTQLMPRKQCENWCLTVSSLLCQESSRMSQPNPNESSAEKSEKLSIQVQGAKNFRIECVEFCVNHDFVMATVGQDRFKLRPNNINSIFIAAVLEEFNNIVGNRNLVKRSLLLIKMWSNYEARKYCTTDLPGLFNHDAMVVLTLCVFTSPQQKVKLIDHPIRALQYFLEIMAHVDWKRQQVTAFGIEPIRSFFSQPTAPTELDRENENLMNLASIVSPFVERFEDNFMMGDDTAMEGLRDDDSGSQPREYGTAGICDIYVADPVKPSRNLCAHKYHDAESLRRIFANGMEDLEDLFAATKDWNVPRMGKSAAVESTKTSNAANMYFPLTVEKAIILNERETVDIRQMQGLFSGLSINKMPSKGDPDDSKYPDTLASSIQFIVFMIKHAEMVASTKLNADVFIHLVIQILKQHGPLPIGEIGKQLQIKTGNPDLPRVIKKMFMGLKKFISSYPQLFYFEANHNFNPKVHMHLAECAPELTARGSTPAMPSPQLSLGSPIQAQLQPPQMLMKRRAPPSIGPPLPLSMQAMRDSSLQPYQMSSQQATNVWDSHRDRGWDGQLQQYPPGYRGPADIGYAHSNQNRDFGSDNSVRFNPSSGSSSFGLQSGQSHGYGMYPDDNFDDDDLDEDESQFEPSSGMYRNDQQQHLLQQPLQHQPLHHHQQQQQQQQEAMYRPTFSRSQQNSASYLPPPPNLPPPASFSSQQQQHLMQQQQLPNRSFPPAPAPRPSYNPSRPQQPINNALNMRVDRNIASQYTNQNARDFDSEHYNYPGQSKFS